MNNHWEPIPEEPCDISKFFNFLAYLVIFVTAVIIFFMLFGNQG